VNEVRRALAVATEHLRLGMANVTAAVLGSIYVILTARSLGPAQFSDVAVCLSLSYFGLLFLGPLNLTLVRFSSIYRSAGDQAQIRPLLKRAFRLYAPWIGGGVTIAIVFASPIARVLHITTTQLVPWTAVFVTVSLALGAGRATALGIDRPALYGRSLIVETTIRVVAGLVLVVAFRTAGAAIAGFLIGSVSAAALLLAQGRRLPRGPEQRWNDRSDVSHFMTWALVFSSLVAGLQNLDMVAAKVRLSQLDAGRYAVALAVARGLLLLAAPFSALALARSASTETSAHRWSRVVRAPLTAYLALSALPMAVLLIAPGASLRLLFGASVSAQIQVLPVLAVAFLLAGVFLIVASTEIRAGRFAFLAPVGAVLVAEQLLLGVTTPSALRFAWVVLGAQAAAVLSALLAPVLLSRVRRFEGSAEYWEARYARGGESGTGSKGKFAEFKAEILNDFVVRNGVASVIEFGCGDGQQLVHAAYPQYLGLDVSTKAIGLCRTRFAGDRSKEFRVVAEHRQERADLALSLDVIFHLVEDEVFEEYMTRIFNASNRWVIVYSSNHESAGAAEGAHVRHREFTRWVNDHRSEWVLRERIPNRFPFTGDFRLGSFCDFFIFERL
jgi:O-antigen/teichoic acid export membrane protein/SAM-dependent methyltransferase